MKLHQDINAFQVLLEKIHERTGYRTDVLEKDYYVVLMLCELAEKKKAGLPSYFKGGTALYKALKTTGGRTATSCAEPVQEKGRHGEITATDSDYSGGDTDAVSSPAFFDARKQKNVRYVSRSPSVRFRQEPTDGDLRLRRLEKAFSGNS